MTIHPQRPLYFLNFDFVTINKAAFTLVKMIWTYLTAHHRSDDKARLQIRWLQRTMYKIFRNLRHPVNPKHSGFKRENIYGFFHAGSLNIYTDEPYTRSYLLWHPKSCISFTSQCHSFSVWYDERSTPLLQERVDFEPYSLYSHLEEYRNG